MADAGDSSSGMGSAILREIKNNPAALIFGLFSAVAGMLTLSEGRLLATFLGVAIILVWLLPFAPKLKERRTLRFALPGVLSTSMAVAAILTHLHHSTPLAFEEPRGPVSPCSTFKGKGSIPVGKRLLVFDRQVNENAIPRGSGGYYFDGPATATKDGWVIRDIEIGRDVTYDFYAEVTAGLVDAKVADAYIAGHGEVESRLNLPLPEFDSGSKIKIQVARDKERGGC